MKRKKPNYVENSQWDCIENVYAREKTIIELYRLLFQRDSIPKDRQYWTMCGAYFNFKQNRIVKGELVQLLKAGFIKPEQFYGVDREQIIIDKNRELFPEIKWIHGDFEKSMLSYSISGNFNPAIINYDGVMQPVYGMRYLKKIMKLLDWNFSNDVLLIASFVLKNPYRKSDKLTFSIPDTLEELSKIYFFPDHWLLIPNAYCFTGHSRKAKAEMGVLMFLKEKHDINNMHITPNRKIGKGDEKWKNLLEKLKDKNC